MLVPAVRHSDIRNQLIQEADQEAAQYEGYGRLCLMWKTVYDLMIARP